MPRTRKSHPPGLKAKVAIEAIRGVRTTTQIAQTFGIHPNLVANWKKQAMDQLPELFANNQPRAQSDTEQDELYKEIGKLKVELEFLKKRTGLLD
jgi:transposase-like protein